MSTLSHSRPTNEGILVLDYGSQYTLLIARRLREIGVYAEVIDGRADKAPADFNFHGLILSGGPDSVGDEGSRRIPRWAIESKKPILGICYGMQLLVAEFGGKVTSGNQREYGKAEVNLMREIGAPAGRIFYNLPTTQTVWMSHGDHAEDTAHAFMPVGRSADGVTAVVVHKDLPYAGLQFHPEVHHSDHGLAILRGFVENLCRAPINWKPKSFVEATTEYIRSVVGKGHVLMAVSGGVDSTVAAVLMTRALGPKNVTALFVDHGLLRKNEAPWVQEMFQQLGVKDFVLLNSKDLFLSKLKGVTDPEQKRKIIGNTFVEEFERYTADHATDFTHLGQGTLYPDVIESAGHGAGAKVIKSHHNVGGLPEKMKLALVEPFRYLFKDEVRAIGRELGIPSSMLDRHPFPGPGLAVRILGEITEEKIRIVQEADAIFIDALRKEGFYNLVWQAFAVLLPIKSVGVMGDNRTYQWTCALRAVAASDGMTAGVGDLPMSFLTQVSDAIVRRVHGINRVVYDITSKPPATIEWE